MKKYIFSVLMAAMAAFTFSSCEDVPEPYTQPTKPETPGNTDPNQKGSESNPYTVSRSHRPHQDRYSTFYSCMRKG